MRALLQPRNSAIAVCAAAFTLCCLSPAVSAQTPAPAINKGVEPTVGTPGKHQAQDAEAAYLAGARSLDHNDLANAEIQFDKAVKLNPFNSDYANATPSLIGGTSQRWYRSQARPVFLGRTKRPRPCWPRPACLTPRTASSARALTPAHSRRSFTRR